MSSFKLELKKAIEELAKDKNMTYKQTLITIYSNIIKEGEENETNI